MKKIVSLFTVLALLALLTGPVLAGEKKEVELSGWITDEYCGKKNANAKGQDCAIACAKKGSALLLFANDKLYKLSDQKGALEHVGHEVVVKGVLGEDGTIQVTKFEKKEA